VLLLIEDLSKKAELQTLLEENVSQNLANQGRRNIGFPSGNRDEIIYANGEGTLWAAFGDVDDAAIPRTWNVFGVFDPRQHSQFITVEINIPTKSNSARVAGFFARDPQTNRTYLMHDGSVGGGKPGVGRSAFLAWSKAEMIEALAADGTTRSGIIVGNVDSDDLTSRLWKFVDLVRGFKLAVASGELDSAEFRRAIAEWEAYKKEASGRRQGQRKSSIDYFSYHGDVVQCLYDECVAKAQSGDEVLNSPLIDLYVRRDEAMTAIYEVKTSLDRQVIYTAIGQLLCHSSGANRAVNKTLVVPVGALAADLEQCLEDYAIVVRRFEVEPGDIPAIVLR
jgi:hypothetical protein